MGKGRSLELYFIDGRPEGMLTAEVFNWTGHVLKAPRTQIREALARPEAGYTGVYILLGERDGAKLAYIGEAEEIAARLRGHVASKEWWSDVVMITTSSDALHKAHVKYLESRLVEKARAAGMWGLDNGNLPPRSSLSEAAQAAMEEFLETLDLVLPAIGVDVVQSGRRIEHADAEAQEIEPVFTLESAKTGVLARAILDGGAFVVKTGSRVRGQWIGQGEHNIGYKALLERLVASNVILLEGEHGVFQADYSFNSPSAAAAVVTGRAANGRIEWKLPTGQSYHAWEAELIEKPL